ncbi:SAICAR synthase-like protein [Glonium stellatum]|uniref:Kinase n=1 Tax=Glonium stellatum TaxID=574774 RepID=A0A8E2F806_9PEZI|nr:SAICAR synthase-like protein [Glonium stellatum]
MATSNIDPASLCVFTDAAAGHEGVLSDPSGEIVVKPCTPAEVAFYESARQSHPDLAAYMPLFMGTLQLSSSQDASTTAPSSNGAAPPLPPTAAPLELDETRRLHGKKLQTDQCIVLENVAGSFKKPNILDLKLGARLWDDSARPDKRARLDKVAATTTSSPLGFRIAGMRTWQGQGAKDPTAQDEKLKGLVTLNEATEYWVYNKIYGRTFNEQNVIQGFTNYILPPKFGPRRTKAELERASECLKQFIADVKNIQEIFERNETRMVSSSLLLVYEGDAEAFDAAKKILENAPSKSNSVEDRDGEDDDEEEDEEDEDDDDEDEPPKLATVKLIDFAHAKWARGQGPDENVLKGVRSTVKVLTELMTKVNDDLQRS